MIVDHRVGRDELGLLRPRALHVSAEHICGARKLTGICIVYVGPDGWRLSTAYDLNPVPTDIKPRVLSTAIDLEDTTASLDLAMSVADYFEISSHEARAIAAEVQPFSHIPAHSQASLVHTPQVVHRARVARLRTLAIPPQRFSVVRCQS